MLNGLLIAGWIWRSQFTRAYVLDVLCDCVIIQVLYTVLNSPFSKCEHENIRSKRRRRRALNTSTHIFIFVFCFSVFHFIQQFQVHTIWNIFYENEIETKNEHQRPCMCKINYLLGIHLALALTITVFVWWSLRRWSSSFWQKIKKNFKAFL